MERAPHKSSWKERKKGFEESVEKKEESGHIEPTIREKLNKIKRYVIILCILLVVPIIIFFIYTPAIFFIPFISLVAAFVALFMVYFPISDILKKQEK